VDKTLPVIRVVDRRWMIRLLEIIPGGVTWTTLLLPVILSFISPIAVAYFIIAFDLYWTVKSFHISFNLYRAYSRLHAAQKIDWKERLEWLRHPRRSLDDITDELDSYVLSHRGVERTLNSKSPAVRKKYHQISQKRAILQNLMRHERLILDPADIFNVVFISTYNESIEILEPSVKALTEVDYPLKQLMLVICYEERGGAEVEANAQMLIERYGDRFAYAVAIKHPDGIVGEHRGKGANISHAGRIFAQYAEDKGLDPEHIIVTTLDADHRAAKNYFTLLTYEYASDPNRLHHSYQPIPMFYNNIWDAPAPMRVIALGNSFWTLTETMRPHRLRNFAAHAQGLATLLATDFWSVTTIVEDGHQFWRTYFAFNGDHQVMPVYTSVYQDAVLAETYLKTFRAQYLQLRRWAWGCSDIPFVLRNMVKNPEIPIGNRIAQFYRLFESHFSQATAPLILTFVAYLPLYLNPRASTSILAQNLPFITSDILTLASIGIIFMVFFSVISLPPRPKRYKRTKFLGMIAQWILLPVTTMGFSAFAAIDAQTRLMFGKYLEFYNTVKVVKK
jgi:cellulose synthase/poly-beta-1,6-N-acetylglucosamine synthase-like glycosyltransferase